MTVSIEVAKQDLVTALKVVSATVGTGADLSSHYLFRVRDGKAEVLSYDLRVFSSSPLTATVEGESGSAFTVEAWRLDKWIASVGEGVLTLSSSAKGEVLAKGPRSKIKLRSLDPSRFPFWDKLLESSKSAGSMLPAPLLQAIQFNRLFVEVDDTNAPNHCLLEGSGGVLRSFSKPRGIGHARVAGMPDLKILGKDIPAVVKFLADKTTQEGEIGIRSASRPDGSGAATIFERPDGSYIGVSEPTQSLPKLPDPETDAPTPSAKLTVDVDELQSAAAVLLSSAPKGHESITFSVKGGVLTLSMPSDAGGVDDYPTVSSTETGMDSLSFNLSFPSLKALAAQFKLDTLVLGVYLRGSSGGFVGFDHTDDVTGSRYITFLPWRV